MSNIFLGMDIATIAALRQEYLRRGGPLKMTPETVRAVFVMPNPQPMVEEVKGECSETRGLYTSDAYHVTLLYGVHR